MPPALDDALDALRHVPAEELTERRWDLQMAAQNAGATVGQVAETINSREDLPRDLLESERIALLAVLRGEDFDGRDALLAQVPHAQVSGYCGCGCATVDLVVDVTKASPAPNVRSPIPNEAEVLDENGEPEGGLLVFVNDAGYLSSFEVYSNFPSDVRPPVSPFPDQQRIQPHQRQA